VVRDTNKIPENGMKEKIITINSVPLYKIDAVYVAIISTDTFHVPDVGNIMESFRKMFPDVMIQGINPKFIFGIDHIFEVIQIVLELNNRKIKIAKRLEMEVLLRLICSNQVDKAIDIGGIKNNCSGCFILLSENRRLMTDSIKYLRKMFAKQDLALLNATTEKIAYICNKMGFSISNYSKTEFLKILTEKAALVSQ
jgi:tRNA threonylcarbamoyladenosine modification (KEOPS) complex Cgi121 subunit